MSRIDKKSTTMLIVLNLVVVWENRVYVGWRLLFKMLLIAALTTVSASTSKSNDIVSKDSAGLVKIVVTALASGSV